MQLYLKLILDQRVDKATIIKLTQRYPASLALFPDNVPDYRLPRDALHTSAARGGLAAAMRPSKIGGTAAAPVYDIQAAGIPTISFVPGEPFSEQHIQHAFELIDGFVENCQTLIVPYLPSGEPAFGGGVAASLSAQQLALLKQGLDKLAQRCAHTLQCHVSHIEE